MYVLAKHSRKVIVNYEYLWSYYIHRDQQSEYQVMKLHQPGSKEHALHRLRASCPLLRSPG